jgi:alpha-mannosidase
MYLRTYLIAACCLLSHAAPSRAEEPPGPKKETFWVIPHTHWEGAVFKTREEYLEMGLPNILKAMRLLREQPSFRFTLDQVAYVRPFLERYPSEEADFRRFLAEGRLQLAGGLDVMPDVNIPGGETFVRQMQYGKGYYREKLGVDVTAGWLIDTFGHHAQMPQLMAQAGYKSYWFVRGVPKQNHPAEFLWEGIDGTRIAAYYLPHSYALMYGSPKDATRFLTFAKNRFDSLSPNTRGPNRVALTGPDVSEPEEHLAPMIELFNREGKAPFAMRMAVPADYEAAVPPRPDWPVFKGELNPIFQGTYSSRIELKSWMRIEEQKILTAEKLAALADCMGVPADLDAIWSAWEPVLFNETHDLTSGVMTDHVYDDTVRSYEYSLRRADAIIDAKWDILASKIDTRGPGAPVVVFNTLGWPRSDIVEIDAGFGEGGVSQPILTDSEGRDVPAQIVEASRYGDGSLKTARLAFVARDVPALGYRTYHVEASRRPKASQAPEVNNKASASKSEILENSLYRIALDPATGAMTSLRVKADDWEVLAGPANVVARQQDRGDLWELYKGLDGGSRVAMTTQQPVPKRGQAVFSDQGRGDPARVTHGPVFSEFTVARSLDSGRFATTVRLYHGLRRIDIKSKLVNREKYVRYQALFPTAITGGANWHEIPFGSVERPNAIEFPAQNWVDHGDGRHGLALLNMGLPGNLTTDGTMMVSLLRAHTLGAYGFGGGFEPGMSSNSGFQIGQDRTLRYALVPHSGDWREAGVFRDGLEFNHPLLHRNVLPHSGPLPKRWGLLDVSNPNVVVSSFKPTRDREVALRVYEASGRPASQVTLKFQPKVLSAHESNLLEEVGRELKIQGESVQFDLHPYEIKTIRLRLRGAT